MKDREILTIEEIAMLTNCSVKYLRREAASGSLKSFRKNNKISVLKEDYKKWISNCEVLQKEKKIAVKKVDIVNWVDVSKEMESINAWKNQEQLTDFNFIDLFSGAGGLSCGLVMAGMKPVASIEIMQQAVETYNYNFSKLKCFNEQIVTKDIREESVKQELVDKVKDKHIHLIAGGFPCQGFSMAGNRIIADPRNSLYLDMLEIVRRIKPEFVLMENVEGIRSMLNGKIEQKIINDYREIGYSINVTVLNSADYGVPQIRKRVVFIGNRIGCKNCHPKPMYNEREYRTVGDALTKYLNIDENFEINHIFTKSTKEMFERMAQIPVGKSLYKNYSDAWKKVDWNKPSCTVKENHGGVNIHPIKNRLMTPRELAELQSFPDDFIFKGSKKWQLVQIGNAVPCLLGKAVGFAILKSYKEGKNE